MADKDYQLKPGDRLESNETTVHLSTLLRVMVGEMEGVRHADSDAPTMAILIQVTARTGEVFYVAMSPEAALKISTDLSIVVQGMADRGELNPRNQGKEPS